MALRRGWIPPWGPGTSPGKRWTGSRPRPPGRAPPPPPRVQLPPLGLLLDEGLVILQDQFLVLLRLLWGGLPPEGPRVLEAAPFGHGELYPQLLEEFGHYRADGDDPDGAHQCRGQGHYLVAG